LGIDLLKQDGFLLDHDLDNDVAARPVPVDPAFAESVCPKCGMETEPIESGAEGPALQHLELCPHCYLVTWSDEHGLHVRQGVPMKEGVPVDKSAASGNVAEWISGEPEEC
jgi:hypothetical protein